MDTKMTKSLISHIVHFQPPPLSTFYKIENSSFTMFFRLHNIENGMLLRLETNSKKPDQMKIVCRGWN